MASNRRACAQLHSAPAKAAAAERSPFGAGVLPTPAELRAQLDPSPAARAHLQHARAAIAKGVAGGETRLLVVIGPCSVHDSAAALEYAQRLQQQAARFEDDLLVAMRVYLEKPRSSLGWKGFISDPHLDGSCDVAEGLWRARQLLVRVATLGMPIATELLDINLASYLEDLVSWAAIGARTVGSQPHRELASGLTCAVGLKNSVDGSLDTALGGLASVASSHTRIALEASGRVGVRATSGNPHAHLTLRGGSAGPNYSATHVAHAADKARQAGLRDRVLVDCSHGNSNKNHDNQPRVVESLARQLESGSPHILGVMIESHLLPGRQSLPAATSPHTESPSQLSRLTYGQSITDACVGWETSVQLLERLALARRRRTTGNAAKSPPRATPRAQPSAPG